MRPPGRPRQHTELEELRKAKKTQREWLRKKIREVIGKPDRFQFAWKAATVLHTLEQPSLSDALRAACKDRIKRLRNTNVGYAVDPYGRKRDSDFLEAFIQKCAPGWEWRKHADNENRAAAYERNIRERAQMLRCSRASANRHVLPEAPDPSWLIYLAKRIKPNELMSWPTLRELKLAMAFGERPIKRIIQSAHPKTSEIVMKTPKRFAPRLVLAVVEVFLNRCPGLEIHEKQRVDCIAAGLELHQHLVVGS